MSDAGTPTRTEQAHAPSEIVPPEAVPLAPAKPLPLAAAGEIRPLAAADIEAVAALFQKTFRHADGPAPASLCRYLDGLFLHHPWADADLPSRVHVAPDGAVNGFIGVLPARMVWNGRPLRAAIAGSLAVDDPQRNPLAGAKLLRAFLKGPQDLSFSDSANPISQGMWERIGGTAVPAYSMEWLRILRPFGTGIEALARWTRVASMGRSLAAGLDRLFAPLSARFLGDGSNETTARGSDADEAALVELLPQFASAYALRPDWDADTLRWILRHARDKERHGPLTRRVVRGRNGKPVGCYLYFGRPREVAWVLQLLARPGDAGAVIDDLLAHARQRGCVAVRGRTQPDVLDALLRRNCVMLHRASTVVHARDGELLRAVRAGEALLTGLAGESWTRLIGGTFA